MEKNGRARSFVFRVVVFILVCTVPAISPATKSSKAKEQKTHVSSCLKLGQGETQHGTSGADDKLPIQCCKPLKDREPSESCGVPTGGPYQYVCMACGDGKCDANLENTCNCAEDCK